VTTDRPRFELTPTLEIQYDIGQEHSPTNPYGRTLLVLRGDGALRVDRWGGHKGRGAWEARVDPAVLRQLLDALAVAHDPRTGPPVYVPDAAIARFDVTDDETRDYHSIDWYEGQRLEGYREALRIADSINHQASAGVLDRGVNDLPPCVHDARPVSL